MATLDLLARTSLVILVNGLWQGALVAGVTWLALRAFPRVNASTRYAAWVLALLATAIVPIVTSIPHVEFVSTSSGSSRSASAPSRSVEHHQPRAGVASSPTTVPATSQQPTPRLTIPQRPAVHLNAPAIALVALFALWTLAAIAMLARLAVALLRLEKLKHDALPLGIETRDRLEQYRRASETTRDVRICITDGIDVPVAVGLFDAMVLLPHHLIDTLDASELDQITLHELAHLLRHDDWTNGLQRFISALFFFNPAVWFIGRQLDIEREVACDDYVLELTGAVRSYAFCLTKMAEMTAWPHQPLAAPGVFITRKNISIRIERLLRSGRAISSAISPGIAGGVVGGLVVACALAWFGTPRVAFALPAPVVAPSLPPLPAEIASIKPETVRIERVSTTSPAAPHVPEAEPSVPAIPAVPATRVTTARVQTHDAKMRTFSVDVPKIDIPPIHVSVPKFDNLVAQAGSNCGGCDYSSGHFGGKNFSHSNLTGSNFAHADLHGARFDEANLSGADFDGANLENASFDHANMTGCNLQGARLAGAHFNGANLSGCSLDPRALSPDQAAAFLTNCVGCDLEGAHLDGMDLRNVHLEGDNLSGASMRNVNLSGARLVGLNLSGVDLSGANLNGTTFSGCNLSGADLRNVDLSTARFVGSQLTDARMNR